MGGIGGGFGFCPGGGGSSTPGLGKTVLYTIAVDMTAGVLYNLTHAANLTNIVLGLRDATLYAIAVEELYIDSTDEQNKFYIKPAADFAAGTLTVTVVGNNP